MTDRNLRAVALRILGKHNGDPVKAVGPFMHSLRARPALLRALALEYLEFLCGRQSSTTETQVVVAPQGGHLPSDTQREDAAEPEAGQKEGVTQPERAGLGPSSDNVNKPITVREHKRKQYGRRRTAAEREAARRGAEFEASVYERHHLPRYWREMLAVGRENAVNAVSYLELGFKQATTAILISMVVEAHQVSDPNARVEDVVTEAELRRLEPLAQRIARERIAAEMSGVSERLVAPPSVKVTGEQTTGGQDANA